MFNSTTSVQYSAVYYLLLVVQCGEVNQQVHLDTGSLLSYYFVHMIYFVYDSWKELELH